MGDPMQNFNSYFSTALPPMMYAGTGPSPLGAPLLPPPISAPNSASPSWLEKNKMKLIAVVIFAVAIIIVVVVIKKRKQKETENDPITNNQIPFQQQPTAASHPQQQQRPVSLDPNLRAPMPSNEVNGTMRLPTMVNPGANGMYPTPNPPTQFPSLQQQPQMPTQQQQQQVPIPINAGDEMTDPNFTPLPKARR